MENVQTLPRPALMRNILLANIAFCLTFAALFTFGASAVADFADVDWEIPIRLLGVDLFIFAGFVFYAMRTMNRRLIWAVFALDMAWVIGSCVLLAFDLLPVSTAAKWDIAFIADAVLGFALLELWALRRTA